MRRSRWHHEKAGIRLYIYVSSNHGFMKKQNLTGRPDAGRMPPDAGRMDIHAWISMHGFVKLVCNIVSHEIYAHHVKVGEKSVSRIGFKAWLDENNPHLHKINFFYQELTLLSMCSSNGRHRAIFSKHPGLRICIYRVECALSHGSIESSVNSKKMGI